MKGRAGKEYALQNGAANSSERIPIVSWYFVPKVLIADNVYRTYNRGHFRSLQVLCHENLKNLFACMTEENIKIKCTFLYHLIFHKTAAILIDFKNVSYAKFKSLMFEIILK